ncbi:hypothetical protein [Amaricoccus sp. W119]|uniref:hypothetical protein n=1 Tax=Amaricoccus sp. W119 TaxID=3391833 RepID=UPI0039A5C47C
MTYFPRNGDQRGSDRWDAASKAWVRADEWQARQWAREDRAFERRMNQGQLATPVVISDSQGGVRGVQSMLNGEMYDSKSNMRRHYRERGATEIGNDVPTERVSRKREPDSAKIKDAIGRAFNRVGLPTC